MIERQNQNEEDFMRTQIRALNEATEMKTGGNGNGHAAHIHSIDRLAAFVGRLGQKTGCIGVTLPENAKRPDSTVFERSPWTATGTLIVNTPGNRLAEAPMVFVKSLWITTGVLKVNMSNNKPATASRAFVISPWITTGVLRVTIAKNKPAAFSKFFLTSKWITSGIFKLTTPANKPAAVPGSPVRKTGSDGSNTAFLRSPWIISYGIFPAEKMRHSIENSLRLVAALVSVKQDRTLPAYSKAA
jgi:hypothetical protein